MIAASSKAEQLAEDLRAQEIRAVAKYGHTKEADTEWPPEHAPKFARWLAHLHEYEAVELAEQARPAPRQQVLS